jgi:D-alanyl-D-alanine carboxypeptidase (penicillin-binding protein 5/6)
MTLPFKLAHLSLALALSLGVAAVPVQAQTKRTTAAKPAPAAPAAPAPSAPVMSPLGPQAPEIAARSFLVMDVTSGQILAAKDVDSPVEPASLTKLMTAYLVFQALEAKKISLEQTLPVSQRAWKTPGSRMFIDPKMQVPVDDLIKGMIVQSGNDATVALAEGVGGTYEHFVELMNQQAKQLGLSRTSYRNPEGLTEAGHTTTARDLAVLSTRLMQDFPQHMHYYAMKKYRYPGTPAANDTNRNRLLHIDPTVDGLKTGHTEAAGYCLIATAKRDFPNVPGRRLLTVVLGTASESARANESQKLLNWGYTAFDDVKLFDADQAVESPKVWKGEKGVVKIGAKHPIVVTVPSGQGAQVKSEVTRNDPLVAPLQAGQNVGTLTVKLGDKELTKLPLVALEPVAQAGWFGRTWDALRLWIK